MIGYSFRYEALIEEKPRSQIFMMTSFGLYGTSAIFMLTQKLVSSFSHRHRNEKPNNQMYIWKSKYVICIYFKNLIRQCVNIEAHDLI